MTPNSRPAEHYTMLREGAIRFRIKQIDMQIANADTTAK